MTDNFLNEAYRFRYQGVQFVYYRRSYPRSQREADEQARHVGYFPRPNVVTSDDPAIDYPLCSYAHRVLNRRNVVQKDNVSYDVWYGQGHDARARMRADVSHGSSAIMTAEV